MLATLSHADLGTIFVVLAIVAFALALYVGYLGNIAGAIVLGGLGVILVLLFA